MEAPVVQANAPTLLGAMTRLPAKIRRDAKIPPLDRIPLDDKTRP